MRRPAEAGGEGSFGNFAFTVRVSAERLGDLALVMGLANKEGHMLVVPEAVRAGEKDELLVDACARPRGGMASFSPRCGTAELSEVADWLAARFGEVGEVRGLALSLSAIEDAERIDALERLAGPGFAEAWPDVRDLELLAEGSAGLAEMVERAGVLGRGARGFRGPRPLRSAQLFACELSLDGADGLAACEGVARASRRLHRQRGMCVYPAGAELRDGRVRLGLVCEPAGLLGAPEVAGALSEALGCEVASCVPTTERELAPGVLSQLEGSPREDPRRDACLFAASPDVFALEADAAGASGVVVGTLLFPEDVSWESVAQGAAALAASSGIELLPRGTVRTAEGLETRVACRRRPMPFFGRGGFGLAQAALVERYLGCRARLRALRALAELPGEQEEAREAERELDAAGAGVLTARSFSAPPESAAARPSARARLEGMVGLASVKRQVTDIVDFAARKRELDPEHMPALHTCMLGPAGTGKTTVARLMGEMLGEAGVLEHPERFVEVDRSSLVAAYVGQTALKVRRALAQAEGGVLYVDEAYELGASDSANDFGHEAIATLVKGMEDLRASTVVILSGYTGPMQKLMAVNEGLVSRIGYFLDFKPYTAEELMGVFRLMAAERGMEVSAGAEAALAERFARVASAGDDTFGNARYARRLVERCEKCLVVNGDGRLLTPELAARALSEPDLEVGSPRRPLGFA